MKLNTFKGNPYEIGKQKGVIYKQNGLTLGWAGVENNPNIFKQQLKTYEKYYPEMIEEVKGIAKGACFDEKETLNSFLTSEIYWYTNNLGIERECTIFGVQNKNGAFVGRNYDWHPSSERLWEIYKIRGLNKHSVVAITDMATAPKPNPTKTFYYADDAINDKGLFVGLTFSTNDKWSFGIAAMHMVRFIAERCKSVNEAIDIFKDVPICVPKNFFIADKEGRMAVVEHTSKKFKVLRPRNGVLIQTNHYIDPILAKEDKVLEKTPFHNTYLRYYEALQRIEFIKKDFKFKDITKILGHKSYIYQNFKDVKTIWSLGLDMMNQNYMVYWNLTGKVKNKKIKP